MAIQWAQEAWKEVTGTKIKNCFEECGVAKSNDDLMEDEEDNLESEAFLRDLSPDCQSQSMFILTPISQHLSLWSFEHEVDWQGRLIKDCANVITTQSNVSKETQKISDDDDVEEEDDI